MSVQNRLFLLVLLVVILVAARPKWRNKVVSTVQDLLNPTGTMPQQSQLERVENQVAGPPPPEHLGGGLERKMIEIGQRDFWYIEGGARDAMRPTVILLHGILGDKEQWLPVMAQLLRAECHVVAPDLPGCGQNARDPQGKYGVMRQAKRLRAFVAKVGGARWHLVGASTGGTIAGALAYAARDQVATLTLIEPFGVRVPYPSALDEMLTEGRNPLMIATPAAYGNLESFLFAHRPSRDRFHDERVKRTVADRQLNLKIWQAFREGEHANILDLLLPELEVKTLIIQGEKSKVIHPATVEIIPKMMHDARGVVIGGSGHLPMIEKPAEVARHIRQHVGADGAGSTAPATAATPS